MEQHGTDLDPYAFDGETVEDCELKYECCTNTNVRWVDDVQQQTPSLDPGAMLYTCGECYTEYLAAL